MIKIVGVRFKNAGKIYYFDPVDFEIEKDIDVVVETARGLEFGRIVVGPKEIEEEKLISPLKPIIRIATEEDDVMLITDKGTIIRINVKDVSILGRSTQGVTLMRTNDGGKVVSIETLTPDIENE